MQTYHPELHRGHLTLNPWIWWSFRPNGRWTESWRSNMLTLCASTNGKAASKNVKSPMEIISKKSHYVRQFLSVFSRAQCDLNDIEGKINAFETWLLSVPQRERNWVDNSFCWNNLLLMLPFIICWPNMFCKLVACNGFAFILDQYNLFKFMVTRRLNHTWSTVHKPARRSRWVACWKAAETHYGWLRTKTFENLICF